MDEQIKRDLKDLLEEELISFENVLKKVQDKYSETESEDCSSTDDDQSSEEEDIDPETAKLRKSTYKTDSQDNFYLSDSDKSFLQEIFVDIILEGLRKEAEQYVEGKIFDTINNREALDNFISLMTNNSFEHFVETIKEADLEKTEAKKFYDIAKDDKNLFDANKKITWLKNIFFFMKVKFQELKKQANTEADFYEAFINVIHDSFMQFKQLVSELKLEEFKNKRLNFKEVARMIQNNNNFVDIQSYRELQQRCREFLSLEDQMYEECFRSQFEHFFRPIKKINLIEEDSKVFKVTGTLLTLDEALEGISSDCDQIKIQCHVLHVSSDVAFHTRDLTIKNLIINAEKIKIHKAVTIDLSGRNAQPLEILKANTSENGTGLNGKDGYAGESGGHCYINCTTIENSSLLTIRSNGGNGSNGQDGGDGLDGQNGRDVQKSDFNNDNTPFMLRASMKLVFDLGDREIEETNDGIKKFLFVQHSALNEFSLMLLKGKKGTRGKRGGLAGYGGEGGFAGEVQIEVSNSSYINVDTHNGKPGKDGQAGLNGIDGIDGYDAWGNNTFLGRRKFHGLGEKKRFRLKFGDKASMSDNTHVHVKNKSTYVCIEEYKQKITLSQMATRASATGFRSKFSYALAQTNKMAVFQKVHIQHSVNLPVNSMTKYFEALEKATEMLDEALSVSTQVRVVQLIQSQDLPLHESKNQSFSNEKALEIIKNEKIKIKTFLNIIQTSTFNSENFDEFRMEVAKKGNSGQRPEIPFYAFFTDSEQSFIDSKHAVSILEDKITLNEFQKDMTTEQKKIENYLLQSDPDTLKIPEKIEEQIFYLIDTKKFESKQNALIAKSTLVDESLGKVEYLEFASLTHYFNSDTLTNRKQILTFFLEVKDAILSHRISTYNHLMVSIIKTMLKYEKDLDQEVKEDLLKIEVKFNENVRFNDQKSDKVILDILQNFLKNKKISEFIERNLKESGIDSPIYRTLVAYAFKINLRIFVKNIAGGITFVEEHKLDDIRRTEKDYDDEDFTVNLLMHENNFTRLFFDKKKFALEEIRRQAVIDLKIKSENWNFSGENFSHIENSLKKIYAKSSLLDEKKIEIILKVLPASTERERTDLKLTLKNLKLSNCSLLLDVVNHCFFYNNCEFSVKEFDLILTTVLETISEKPYLIDYFPVKFLLLPQREWINDLIMLKIENLLNKSEQELPQYWRSYLAEISHKEFSFLLYTQILQCKKGELTKENLDAIIGNARFFTPRNYQSILELTNLNAWQHVTTPEYWMKKSSFLNKELSEPYIIGLTSKFSTDEIEKLLNIMNQHYLKLKAINKFDDRIRDAFNLALKNFDNVEWILSENLLNILRNNMPTEWEKEVSKVYSASLGQRSIAQISKLINENQDSSEGIRQKTTEISAIIESIKHVRNSKNGKLLLESTENEIKNWINDKENHKPIGSDDNKLAEKLAVILRVFKILTGLDLRYTQIYAILTLWKSEKGALIQVGTGEGKTFIGISFSILKFLDKGQKVHIVTSSSVLAERDAEDEENLKIFKVFGMKVGHNCHDDIQKRRFAYTECDVVYGFLSSFQRDYLLTQFYDEDILKEEHLQNVLVDEVDSILLDKGNNILYLSQELPGIDEINSVLIFIWNWINQNVENKEERALIMKAENVRKAVLNNLYGVVDKKDIEGIIKSIDEDNIEKIHEKLKKDKIINEENVVILKSDENVKEKVFLSLSNFDQSYAEIISLYTEKKLKSEKIIKFPSYYQKFVMHHLNNWIESAQNALIMEDGRQYIVDRTHDGNADKDPNIIIMDIDTGTDQKNSEWDEALCQFLQLKHGCRLSLMSLKSVFISNVTYFKLYKNKYGMTGTLGTKQEREKIIEFYQLDCATIPTFKSRRFLEYPAIIKKNYSEWLEAIVKEINKIVNREDQSRSVLVICNTINDIRVIHQAINNAGKKAIKSENIVTYKRDYEAFDKSPLKQGKIIIATNLAGRGTDIKLSDKLAKIGGLHVILTYLPTNERIEEQAFGRASRVGKKGSARLIINHEIYTRIQKLKNIRNEDEVKRLDEVSAYYKKFISTEEALFKIFQDKYKDYAKTFSDEQQKEFTLENLKVRWSLWLDKESENLKNAEKSFESIKSSLISFVNELTSNDYNHEDIHPITRFKIAKHMDKKENFEDALKVLGINSETFEYNDKSLENSIAHSYYRTYLAIKYTSHKSNYVKRNLTEVEISLIRKTLRTFDKNEVERTVQAFTIKTLKEKFRQTLIEIKGFENQENALNETSKILIESLKVFIGVGITPESFSGKPFDKPLIAEYFYDFLINDGFISKLKFEDNIEECDIKMLNEKYSIDLTSYLEGKKSSDIESFKDLTKDLKENFEFASREDFWDILIQQEILEHETEYLIVEIDKLKPFYPTIHKFLAYQYESSLVNEFRVDSASEIFLYSVKDENEHLHENKKIVLKYSSLLRDDAYLNNLLERRIAYINKKAKFNLQKYKSFGSKNFDSIKKSDFDIIESSIRDEIMLLLIEQGVIIEDTKNSNTYSVKFEKYKNMKLGNLNSYANEIDELFRKKFAFRFALETLVEDIKEKEENNDQSVYQTIALDANPHVMLIHDMVSNFIIVPSKALKIFREYKLEEKLNRYLNKVYVQLNHSNISSDDFEEVKQVVESCVDELHKNIESIDKVFEKSFPILESGSQYLTRIPKLQPIEEVDKSIDSYTLNYMRLKGFDSVITIRTSLFSWNLWNLFIIYPVFLTIGCIVLLIILSLMAFLEKVTILALPGIEKVIYSFNATKNKFFAWSDSVKMFALKFAAKAQQYFAKLNNTKKNLVSKSGITVKTTIPSYKMKKHIFEKGIEALSAAEKSAQLNKKIEEKLQPVSELITTKIKEHFKVEFEKKVLKPTIEGLLFVTNGEEETALTFVNEKINATIKHSIIFKGTFNEIMNKVDCFVGFSQDLDKFTQELTMPTFTVRLEHSIRYDIAAVGNRLNRDIIEFVNSKDVKNPKKFEAHQNAEIMLNTITSEIENFLTSFSKKLFNEYVVAPIIRNENRNLSASILADFENFTKTKNALKKQRQKTRYAAINESKLRSKRNEVGINSEHILYGMSKIKLEERIKVTTVVPEVLANLIQFDHSINEIEIEALARVCKRKIAVSVDGRILLFGKFGDVIKINITNGDEVNANETSDFIYGALLACETENYEIDKLREEVSKKIKNDEDIKDLLKSTKRNEINYLSFFGRSALKEKEMELESSLGCKFSQKIPFGPQKVEVHFYHNNRKEIDSKFYNDISDMKEYNIKRRESVVMAIEKINEKLNILSPELILKLEDFEIKEYFKLKCEDNEFLLYPIVLEVTKEKLDEIINGRVQNANKFLKIKNNANVFVMEVPVDLSEFKEGLKNNFAKIKVYIENPLLPTIFDEENPLGSVVYEITSKYGNPRGSKLQKDTGRVIFGNLKKFDELGGKVLSPGVKRDGSLVFSSIEVQNDRFMRSRVIDHKKAFERENEYDEFSLVAFGSILEENIPIYSAM